MVYCEICKFEFNNLKALSSHIRMHNICSKDYYDTFIKIDGDGICYCGNETNYKSITFGYHTFCSTKCQSNDPNILNKRTKNTKGNNHWTNRIGGPNKGKTYEEIHGIEKALVLKSVLSQYGKKLIGFKNPFYGKKHTEKNKTIFRNNREGKTYEEIFGHEKAKKVIKKKTKNKKERRSFYGLEYTSRFFSKRLRKAILLKQKNICPVCLKCFSKESIKQLHHINYVKKDNRRRNLIYLCVSCHSTTNGNRDIWKGYLRKVNREIIFKDDFIGRLSHIEKYLDEKTKFILLNRRLT